MTCMCILCIHTQAYIFICTHTHTHLRCLLQNRLHLLAEARARDDHLVDPLVEPSLALWYV